MSAKAVEERRLRLVYDALDNYNPKKALQEADKVLKKHPATTTAKVLRALSLLRLERLQEACAVIEEVEANAPHDYDDATLTAFVHCFKELNQPERICAVYERAVAARPDDQNYAALFMSYARVCKYKDQQKVALALYRAHPTPPYYLWAVMSVVMQAGENPAMAEKMLLPLANKMLSKVYEDNKKEWKTAQELELAVLVMQKQGRVSEAADVLESPASQLLVTSSAMILIRVLQLRVAAKQWAAVMERAESALSKSDSLEQWLLWNYLFDAAFGLAEECSEEAEKLRFIDRAFAVVKNAREMSTGIRCPHMAHLEFILRAEKAGVYEVDKYGDKVELLLKYARRFHSRPSCFVDLIKWLHLAGERSEEMVAGVAALVHENMKEAIENRPKGEDDTDLPTTNLPECWAIVLHERVRRWYAIECNQGGPKERRARVLRLARAVLHTKGVQQASAALAHLTAEGLYLNYRRDGDARSLYEAMLVLETAASAWQEDHLTRLALMHIYTLLGVPERMRSLSEQLDIKMVQRDSLGHLGFHAAECGGHIHFSSLHYTSLGEFYDLADREISECIVTAYQKGAFTQIEGVVGMRMKMRNSIMAVAADVANRWVSSAFSLKVIEHVVTIMKGDDDPAEWESLADNRDYSIFPAGDQETMDEIKEYTGWARDEMIDLMRTRHLVMRVAATVAIGTIEAGRGLLRNLEEQLEHCRETYAEVHTPPPTLVTTPPSFIGEWVHGAFLTPVQRLLTSALDAIEMGGGEDAAEAAKLPSEPELTALLAALTGTVAAAIDTPPTKNTVLQLSTVLRFASRAAHSLAFCRQLLRIISLRLIGGAAEEKNTKKTCLRDLLASLVEATKKAAATLEKDLQRAKDQIEENLDVFFPSIDQPFWNVEWAALLLSEKSEVDVFIAQSHLKAIYELQGMLKSI